VAAFEVKRGELGECRLVEAPTPDPGPGEALLRVATFGLTANNVTYGVFGEAMSYWDFFPAAEDGWGRIPVWGFAEVERSEVEGVTAGTRVFGYLPPASHLLLAPAAVSAAGFVDGSPHRAALPSAYHRYLATAADPFYRAGTEAVQMLLRPLFFTSFLLDDQLADDGLTARGPIVLASASSKTALAAAFLLARRPETRLVGLTSPANRGFVEGLGVYSEVLTYDEVEALPREPATYVDFAGDGALRVAVHSHLGERLAASLMVGMTHWERLGDGAGAELAGPEPAFFFAPDRVAKRGKDWGRETLEARVAEAWHPFCEWVGSWLEPIPGEGFEAVRDAYLDVLSGGVPPRRAHVLALP
jgi:NADPH:quinone reductase-like Zn-dependent oxidoreductase